GKRAAPIIHEDAQTVWLDFAGHKIEITVEIEISPGNREWRPGRRERSSGNEIPASGIVQNRDRRGCERRGNEVELVVAIEISAPQIDRPASDFPSRHGLSKPTLPPDHHA